MRRPSAAPSSGGAGYHAALDRPSRWDDLADECFAAWGALLEGGEPADLHTLLPALVGPLDDKDLRDALIAWLCPGGCTRMRSMTGCGGGWRPSATPEGEPGRVGRIGPDAEHPAEVEPAPMTSTLRRPPG